MARDYYTKAQRREYDILYHIEHPDYHHQYYIKSFSQREGVDMICGSCDHRWIHPTETLWTQNKVFKWIENGARCPKCRKLLRKSNLITIKEL